MDQQAGERIRVLIKSGRDKIAAAFATLDEVRKEIGDAALPGWCISELHMGISVITKMAGLLQQLDAERIRTANAAAVAVERARRDANRRAREDAEMERERRKAEHAHKVAELNADTARLKEEEESRRYPTERSEEGKAMRRGRDITNGLSGLAPHELATRLRKARKLRKEAHPACKIEGAICEALILYEVRGKLPANRDLGDWLQENGADLSYQDRTALVGLGRKGRKELRKIFAENAGQSYPEIWDRYKPPLSVAT
jgi:hypothetical protein